MRGAKAWARSLPASPLRTGWSPASLDNRESLKACSRSSPERGCVLPKRESLAVDPAARNSAARGKTWAPVMAGSSPAAKEAVSLEEGRVNALGNTMAPAKAPAKACAGPRARRAGARAGRTGSDVRSQEDADPPPSSPHRAFSPDSSPIAFSREAEGAPVEVYRLDGTGLTEAEGRLAETTAHSGPERSTTKLAATFRPVRSSSSATRPS